MLCWKWYCTLLSQGGSKEIFHTDRDSKETVLELSHRFGFVKLALKFGVPLVSTD